MARIAMITITLSVIALVTAVASIAGVQRSQQASSHRRQIAYIESLGIRPPCCWEISKFRHTRSLAQVESVKLLAANVRDAAGRRVALLAVKIHNFKRKFYARLRFKIRAGFSQPVSRGQLLGASSGYVRLKPLKLATWEDILVPGITETIFFVVHYHDEDNYCVSGRHVPRKCSG